MEEDDTHFIVEPGPLNDGNIAEGNIYEVFLTGKRYIFPKYCSLCCKEEVAGYKKYSSTYRGKEYIVAHENVTVTVDNVPFCSDCLERTKTTKSEKIVYLLGLALAVPIVALLAYINLNYLCGYLILGVLIWAGVVYLGLTLTKDVSEIDSLSFYATKNWIKFSFRNKKFAQMFNELNNPGANRYLCNKCGSILIWNLETNNWICYNCSIS